MKAELEAGVRVDASDLNPARIFRERKSAAREAVVLPVLFLTVALLAGVRIGQRVVLVPPSVFALVLGVLLVRLSSFRAARSPPIA